MRSSPERRLYGRADNKFWIAVTGILVLVTATVAYDGYRRAQLPALAATQWMRALDLDMPAFWPAGSPLRAPMAAHPAVPLELPFFLPLSGSTVSLHTEEAP